MKKRVQISSGPRKGGVVLAEAHLSPKQRGWVRILAPPPDVQV